MVISGNCLFYAVAYSLLCRIRSEHTNQLLLKFDFSIDCSHPTSNWNILQTWKMSCPGVDWREYHVLSDTSTVAEGATKSGGGAHGGPEGVQPDAIKLKAANDLVPGCSFFVSSQQILWCTDRYRVKGLTQCIRACALLTVVSCQHSIPSFSILRVGIGLGTRLCSYNVRSLVPYPID